MTVTDDMGASCNSNLFGDRSRTSINLISPSDPSVENEGSTIVFEAEITDDTTPQRAWTSLGLQMLMELWESADRPQGNVSISRVTRPEEPIFHNLSNRRRADDHNLNS